jgi:hypothetical protein
MWLRFRFSGEEFSFAAVPVSKPSGVCFHPSGKLNEVLHVC